MATPIKLLLVEDTAEDAELLIREMRRGGLDAITTRVDTRRALEQALAESPPDAILCDYSLPGLSGVEALHIARERCPDAPFIFVSGTIGEERAIEALRQGATDYVLKDNRARLVPALERALGEARDRRARCVAETEREETERRFRLFMTHFPGAVYMRDLSGRYTYLSPGAESMIAQAGNAAIWRSSEAGAADGRPGAALVDGGGFPERSRVNTTVEEISTSDGVHFFQTQRFPIFDLEGRPTLWGGIALDVTERVVAENAQRDGARLMNAIIESALDCIVAIDQQGRIVEFNPASEAMFGHSREVALGRAIDELIIPLRFRAAHRQGLARYLTTGESSVLGKRLELTAVRADGTEFPVELSISAITSLTTPLFVGHIRDISERKRSEERLTYLANHDSLTGLPNRNLFREQLSRASGRAKRSGLMLALMFVDLDRFKEINDSLGHAVGDVLLQAVAGLLKRSLREVDCVARLGGDEFTIIVEDVSHADEVVGVAAKVKTVLSDAIVIDDREFFVTASIGICIDRGTLDIDELLRNAGVAMHRAKEEGRNTYEIYTSEMNGGGRGRLDMEVRLRHALARQEFVLHYQPIVGCRDDEIVGVEALLRWDSPELGLVPPARFIPVAEETGLIVPIGEWVLTTACSQAMRWSDQGMKALMMSVNLSPRQFRQKNLVDVIRDTLAQSGLDAPLLHLEITEGMIMHRPDQAVDLLERLHGVGVRLSVDDFGTGYSSLSYLKKFPVQELKIDRSFVEDLTSNEDAASIVAAIIAMARSLKLDVVAEGVETSEQLAFLKRLECTRYQGYVHSRPMLPEDIARLCGSSPSS